MSSKINRNFNSSNMKIAFFDMDIDERSMVSLDETSMKKLLKAIDYGIERASNREIDVRMFALINPDLDLSTEQKATVMTHIANAGRANILSTIEDIIVLQLTDKKHTVIIKIFGGSSFNKVATGGDSSEGSKCEDYSDFGLTQVCFIP